MSDQRKIFRSLALWVVSTTFITLAFPYVAFVAAQRKIPPSFFWIWNRWDTVHYLAIAKNGYVATGIEHFSIAFFPLYPLMIRLFSGVIPNEMVAALAVSQLAYGAAVFYLYKLASLDEPHETALAAVLYFSVFPVAYFLHAAYTESLYLSFVLSSFYYARREKWALAGVLGMLAAFTRVMGITLIAALLIEYAHQKQFKMTAVRKNILWLMLLPLGFGVQALIAWRVNGNPFYFIAVQGEHWHHHPAFPWKGFLNAWRSFPLRVLNEKITVCASEIFFAALGFCFTLYSLFRMRLSYGCYMLMTWLTITCESFWMSVSRYTLFLFPIYFALARLIHKRQTLHGLFIFVCTLFYGFYLTLFVQGQWAF